MPFRILVVCAGNICRSPAAAQILAAALEDDVAVSSAGLDALVGYGLDPDMATAMRRAGIDPRPHRARRVNPWLLEVADLVLTMDRVQHSRILELAPAALHRTFTLRQFALACQNLRDTGDLAWPVRLAQESRFRDLTGRAGRRGARVPAGSDVVIDDPYRGSAADHDRAVREILEAVRTILDAVDRGSRPSRPPSPLRAPAPRRALGDAEAPVSPPAPPGRAPRRNAAPWSPS